MESLLGGRPCAGGPSQRISQPSEQWGATSTGPAIKKILPAFILEESDVED